MSVLKIFVRIFIFFMWFSSTAAAAQSIDDIFSSLNIDEIDMSQLEKEINADTGFEMDREKYAFGAKRQLDEDTTFKMGVGARFNRSPEYNLSTGYRSEPTQTNRIETESNPIDASPMVGMSVGYKF